MLKTDDPDRVWWAAEKYSPTFDFYRGNCGEPDWLIEDPFVGNFLKVYEEY